MKKNEREIRTPIATEMYLPNLSEIKGGQESWTFRGKVGIGTDTPIEALDVVGGNVRADKLILSRGGIGIEEPYIEKTDNKGIGLFTQDTLKMNLSVGGNFDFKAGNLTTTGNLFLGAGNITTSGQINLTGASTNIITATNVNGDLRLGAGGGTNDLKIDKNGNVDIFENLTVGEALTVSGTGDSSFVGDVGIGTTTPQKKLEVKDGGIAINQSNFFEEKFHAHVQGTSGAQTIALFDVLNPSSGASCFMIEVTGFASRAPFGGGNGQIFHEYFTIIREADTNLVIDNSISSDIYEETFTGSGVLHARVVGLDMVRNGAEASTATQVVKLTGVTGTTGGSNAHIYASIKVLGTEQLTNDQ